MLLRRGLGHALLLVMNPRRMPCHAFFRIWRYSILDLYCCCNAVRFPALFRAVKQSPILRFNGHATLTVFKIFEQKLTSLTKWPQVHAIPACHAI